MAASGFNTVRIPHTMPPRELLDIAQRHLAGPHRRAVDEDRAGAADAVLAPEMGAGKIQALAQAVGEGQAWLVLAVAGAAE